MNAELAEALRRRFWVVMPNAVPDLDELHEITGDAEAVQNYCMRARDSAYTREQEEG